jgi:hypothetical protein
VPASDRLGGAIDLTCEFETVPLAISDINLARDAHTDCSEHYQTQHSTITFGPPDAFSFATSVLLRDDIDAVPAHATTQRHGARRRPLQSPRLPELWQTTRRAFGQLGQPPIRGLVAQPEFTTDDQTHNAHASSNHMQVKTHARRLARNSKDELQVPTTLEARMLRETCMHCAQIARTEWTLVATTSSLTHVQHRHLTSLNCHLVAIMTHSQWLIFSLARANQSWGRVTSRHRAPTYLLHS